MPSCFLHRASLTPVPIEQKASFSLFFGENPRSVLVTILLKESVVSKKEKKRCFQKLLYGILCGISSYILRRDGIFLPHLQGSHSILSPSHPMGSRPINGAFMRRVGEARKKNPYAASLKFESEAKQRQLVFGEVFIVIGYCRHY